MIMDYAYATCLLNEANTEINQENLTAVLEAADCPVQESRVKAVVAALEDIDLDEVVTIEAGGAIEHSRNGDGSSRGDSDEVERDGDAERTNGPAPNSGEAAADKTSLVYPGPNDDGEESNLEEDEDESDTEGDGDESDTKDDGDESDEDGGDQDDRSLETPEDSSSTDTANEG